MTTEELRLMALGDGADTSADELLLILKTRAEARLGYQMGLIRKRYGLTLTDSQPIIPDELSWIVDELVLARFNRLGSEGMKAQSVEGHRIEFTTDDLKAYLADIEAFIKPVDYVAPGKIGRIVSW